jgi:hypothetical protein
MTPPPKSKPLNSAYAFSISFSLFIVVYLLRGFGIFTFLPGGLIWMLLLIAISAGLWYGVEKTRRY